jgi:hypothetical protein
MKHFIIVPTPALPGSGIWVYSQPLFQQKYCPQFFCKAPLEYVAIKIVVIGIGGYNKKRPYQLDMGVLIQ